MTSPAPLPPPPDDAGHREAGEDVVPVGEMTFAEYLAFDEVSARRHEYVGGMVYAMSYGTDTHGAIALNLAARLWVAARGTGCRVYSSSVRVVTPRGNSYVPDVTVDCGPRAAAVSLYREHPCFVAEVLSPSTRRIDLDEKLEHYREIPTLEAYWIIEADWRCVYRHWRDADDAWQFEEIVGDGTLPVPCPAAMTLTLDDVYEDIDVPSEPPPPQLRRVREEGPEYVPDYAAAEG